LSNRTGKNQHGKDARVAILQPMISDYRVAFYAALEADLRHGGISLDLYASEPLGETSLRSGLDDLPFAHRLGRKTVLGKGYWQGYPPFADYDLVLVQQELRALTNYPVFWNRLIFRRPRRVALWGHGTNLGSTDEPSINRLMRRLFIRGADHFFAYTDLSRELFSQRGAQADNITVVNNSIDVSDVRAIEKLATHEWREDKRAELGLGKGPVAVFCSRLTEKKNLPFLIEASRIARRHLPDLSLLIIGDGAERNWIERETEFDPWIKLVGARYGRAKAEALCAADAFCMPFDLGLSILDAFAAGLPVIVAHGARTGPEIAYLEHDGNGLIAAQTTQAYAQAMVKVLSNRACQSRMSRVAVKSAETFSLDSMVRNFSDGIRQVLSQG
jgi:glycosyltransferase involved in cell wall biosynthesis